MLPPSIKRVRALFFIVPVRPKVSEEELPSKACKLICEFVGVGLSPVELSSFKLDDCGSMFYFVLEEERSVLRESKGGISSSW